MRQGRQMGQMGRFILVGVGASVFGFCQGRKFRDVSLDSRWRRKSRRLRGRQSALRGSAWRFRVSGTDSPGLAGCAYFLPRDTPRLRFFFNPGAVTLAQAISRAAWTICAFAVLRRTLVQPPRPQAPVTGTNASGSAPINFRCSSGVSLTIAQPLSG
jgi:hypothetical protein